ncbi:MAG TPA: class F sortase [Dictyobacter sp.]|nr:class F sortase [Dictyobacter sp.]
MQTIRRYWYLFTLLFVLLGFILGGWSWVLLAHLQQTTSTGHSKQMGITQAIHIASPERKIQPGLRLQIPKIGVNAPIETVGVATDGAMDVPSHHPWDDVGWYKFGPYPGEMGSSVIAGHFDRPDGQPAVFWNLHTLHSGDTVIIVDNTGKTLRFRVQSMKLYDANNAPKQKIFGDYHGKFLNLITCAGTWQPARQESSQRLVVYTELQ